MTGGKHLSVAVIGAGAAGLCAARHISQYPGMKATVFEKSEDVGGTWVYSEAVGQGIHSSMYRDLKTNLPKEVMAFPDFPFKPNKVSFLHHTEILAYLQDYMTSHQLEKIIRFSTEVNEVKPLTNSIEKPGWKVTSSCLSTGQVTSSIYDAVMICTGHYSTPSYPHLPGMDQWEGRILHSHNYRRPEDMSGKVVLVLGAAASGQDISIEVAKQADKVYLSHNNPRIAAKLLDNLHQVAGVKSCLSGRRLQLADDTELEVDILLLATGYQYTYPFLHEDCQVSVVDRRVRPLYKHLVNIDHPTMCLVGIPVQICPFPQFDLQVRYFTRLLAGEVPLLSKSEMNKDTKLEESWRKEIGMDGKYFHKMGKLQWDYNRDLATIGEMEPLHPSVESLYDAVWKKRSVDLLNYKKDCYQADGKNGYKLSEN